MSQNTVLIVGAGPTGLTLALWLTQQNIQVRVIDKNASYAQQSRAMAVQARTLELYRQCELSEAVVAAGNANTRMNLWVRGKPKAQIPFSQAGKALTPFPFILTFPQDQHEQLLGERLQAAGVAIERQTELIDFEENDAGVIARIRLADGSEQAVTCRFLAGCDGASSRVRHQLGIGFGGGTYEHLFYVADVSATGPAANGEGHIAIDESDFVAVLPYTNGMRLIGALRDEREDAQEKSTFDDVGRLAIERLGLTITEVRWFSTYRVHHRVADHYRQGKVFLLGDAAHVHSPVGGQGMNTGIGDAINLAWKLATVLRGEAQESLLDSYETERKAFAHRLVHTTDKLFTFVVSNGSFANFVRTRIIPSLIKCAFSFARVRERLFRVVSQTEVAYLDSPLSRGRAGNIKGGERLPWVEINGRDNHSTLSSIRWQVHVYGQAAPSLREWCTNRNIALHEFTWDKPYRAAGFIRNAAYLIRPDTYIAVTEASGRPDVFEAYFARLGLMAS